MNVRTTRRAAAAAFTLPIALLAGACASTDASEVTDDDAVEVTVGTLRQPHLYHPDLYEDALPAGSSVEVIPFDDSTEIKNAVITGSIDFGVTGITATVQGSAQGDPVVIVASAADGGSAIVAREGIETVEDLAGQRIGYVPGSAQDILLRLTLQDAGMDADTDVELVRLGFADMPQALASGDLDAFSGAETGPSQAIVDGAGELVTQPYDTAMGRINIVMISSDDYIAAEPETVQLLVEAHAAASEQMAADPEAWAAAVVESYGFPEEALAMAIENIEPRWDIDEDYIAQTRVLGENNEELNQIEQQPDYDVLFDTTFVDAIE